jgi:hypothetical protein
MGELSHRSEICAAVESVLSRPRRVRWRRSCAPCSLPLFSLLSLLPPSVSPLPACWCASPRLASPRLSQCLSVCLPRSGAFQVAPRSAEAEATRTGAGESDLPGTGKEGEHLREQGKLYGVVAAARHFAQNCIQGGHSKSRPQASRHTGGTKNVTLDVDAERVSQVMQYAQRKRSRSGRGRGEQFLGGRAAALLVRCSASRLLRILLVRFLLDILVEWRGLSRVLVRSSSLPCAVLR